jgi:hypothetical protein
MLFTKLKVTLGNDPKTFPFWCEPWRPTWKIRSPDALPLTAETSAKSVKFGLALLQVPGPTGHQAISWRWLASERITGQRRNFPKFRRVVGVSTANFGHKTPPTPRKGINDQLRRKSASDWYVTLSLLDQNWAYFSILKFQDHIFWNWGSRKLVISSLKCEQKITSALGFQPRTCGNLVDQSPRFYH